MYNSYSSISRRKLLLFIAILIPVFTFSQNAWNAVNFKISKDTAVLESMTGSLPMSYSAASPNVTDTIPFPAGFVFKFGQSNFTCFSACDNGYIRLGAKVQTIYYSSEPNIIGAFVEGFFYDVISSWKITGTAPYRKVVIEWAGRFDQTNQNIRYQLWLHETNGKVEIVHSGVNSFPSSASNYDIFCHTQIAGLNALASIKIQNDGRGTPVADYTSIPSNNAGIPANTKYIFAPDTTRPVRPGIVFSNVLPGCFTVSLKDSSINESKIVLEKMKTPGVFVTSIQQAATDIPGTGTLYSVNEVNQQPDSLYTYRAFSTNGFVNSDTTSVSVRTLMPQLTGNISIPADYPSLNTFFADALCKHMYGQVVVELQQDYSYVAENGTIQIVQAHYNKFIEGITIRPAADVSGITLANSTARFMLLVDSVNFVTIDGRPGGQGNTGVLTFSQLNGTRPAIAYVNGSRFGNIRYLKMEGINTSLDGLLHLGTNRPGSSSNGQKSVSYMTVSNCVFGAPSGTSSFQVVSTSGEFNLIRDNQFSRFGSCAVLCRGGKNSRVVNNRFFRPEPITNTGTYSIINAENVGENFAVDSNRIGGSVPQWGQGLWQQGLSSTLNCSYPIIKVTGDFLTGTDFMVYIRNNEIANMKITGSCLFRSIYVKGNCSITGNRIGASDSAGSISTEFTQAGIIAELGSRAVVDSNFIGGLKATSATMINVNNMDTAIIRNNDAGGSDNYMANEYTNGGSGISVWSTGYGLIRNNTVRGFYGAGGSASGLSLDLGLGSLEKYSANVDSNIIHHIQGRRYTTGIDLKAPTDYNNTISSNKIYSLKCHGPADGQGGSVTGIRLASFTRNVISDTGIAFISANKLYAFDYNSTLQGNYGFPMVGISSEGHNVRIHNNTVSLGINSQGQASDSLWLYCTGISVSQSQKPAFVEHNSIFIGGAGNSNRGISFTTENLSNGRKNIFLTNNIISLNRRRGNLGDNKYYLPYGSSSFNNAVAGHNIWYSENDTAINSKLQLWKSVCMCDSTSFIADPAFINAYGDSISHNLHLQPGSPAEMTGLPPVIQIQKDMDGQMRQDYTPHDIGADATLPCPTADAASIQLSTSRELVEFCAPFQLTASLNGPVTNLQWQRNLFDIPGATGNGYTVTLPGSYRLIGQSACGLVASPSVMFILGVTPPQAALQPAIAGADYCDGDTARFNVSYNVSTDYPVQIQWYKEGVLLPGKTSVSEVIEDIHDDDEVGVRIKYISPCSSPASEIYLRYTLNVNSATRPILNVISFRDSLYTTSNRDTVKYKITGATGYYPSVLYLTPVTSPLHSYNGDSLLIFSNIPYTIKFRLLVSSGIRCFYPDTSDIKTIYVSNTQFRTQYIFTGNGNWTTASNWVSNQVPPSVLPFNGEIIISPSVNGSCILNTIQQISPRGTITVSPGARFIILGELRQEQ